MQEMAAKSDVLFGVALCHYNALLSECKCVFVKKHLTFFIKRAIIIVLCLKMISTFSDSFRK